MNGSSTRAFLARKGLYEFQGHRELQASDATKYLPCPRPMIRDSGGRVDMSFSGGGMVEGDNGGKATASTSDVSWGLDQTLDYPPSSNRMLAKTVAKKAATSSSKGMVIFEVFESPSKKRPLDDGSKGKQVTPLLEVKKAKTNGVQAVILPADKEKVEKLIFDQVVTKFFHIMGQARVKEKKTAEEYEARNKEMTQQEAQIAELEKSQALAKGRIIAEFKESKDFQEAVMDLVSSYFGDGFDFCKR
ncbi:hypothetical protein Acr_00g0066080 [Actinidia rufa]|uniref:Uncharacterized protein n=1 Tax=Actinidia rufa TaxID=165716 RepID=A0A7J0DQJ0_9ERIC|nr:hypothetical protein Acr_00g0066080 [Actinidia rufa]